MPYYSEFYMVLFWFVIDLLQFSKAILKFYMVLVVVFLNGM